MVVELAPSTNCCWRFFCLQKSRLTKHRSHDILRYSRDREPRNTGKECGKGRGAASKNLPTEREGIYFAVSNRSGTEFKIIDIIAYNPEMSYEDNIRMLFDSKYDATMAEAICQAMAEYDKLHPQKHK